MLRPHPALLLIPFLAACTPTKPAEEGPHDAAAPAPDWRLEALAQQKAFGASAAEDRSGYTTQIKALLTQPDPPAVPGPELRVSPGGPEVAWPPAKAGTITVRYRIERKDCRPMGSDMGCHLIALCPVATADGSALVATFTSETQLDPQPLRDLNAEVVELPSDRCELRLYARDHHGSAICTARWPKVPAGTGVIDVGTIAIDSDGCQPDALAERMVLRNGLAMAWKRRQQQGKKP